MTNRLLILQCRNAENISYYLVRRRVTTKNIGIFSERNKLSGKLLANITNPWEFTLFVTLTSLDLDPEYNSTLNCKYVYITFMLGQPLLLNINCVDENCCSNHLFYILGPSIKIGTFIKIGPCIKTVIPHNFKKLWSHSAVAIYL